MVLRWDVKAAQAVEVLVGWLFVRWWVIWPSVPGRIRWSGHTLSISVPPVPHFHKSCTSAVSVFPSILLLVPWLFAYLEVSLTTLFGNDRG